jgi:3-mercaptopyruvate sulfurtransferase SseA
MLNNGFKNAKALKGGWNAWVSAGGEVETKQEPRKIEPSTSSAQF